MNQAFQRIKDSATSVEGMLSVFSMAMMDCLLGFQQHAAVSGNICEFGVFKGRSAVVLAHHAKSGERLILVDRHPYIERAAIERLFPAYEFLHMDAKDILRRPDRRSLHRAFKFIHLDSGHGFSDTISEMNICDTMLSDDGLLVLDDFTNLNFSQIIAGLYRYLWTTRTDLEVALVTSEKAVLCRRKHFPLYESYFLNRIADDMKDRDAGECCIARTDYNDRYRAIHLRSRFGDEGPQYAPHLYGNYYRQHVPKTKLSLRSATRFIKRRLSQL